MDWKEEEMTDMLKKRYKICLSGEFAADCISDVYSCFSHVLGRLHQFYE